MTVMSPACHGTDDEERLGPGHDGGGKRRVRGLVRQVLLAGEEAHERAPIMCGRVTDGSLQHWIAGLERVYQRALGGQTGDLDLYFQPEVCERAQMRGQHNPDHGKVWTSTDSTAGRSRTTGAQLFPALAEA